MKKTAISIAIAAALASTGALAGGSHVPSTSVNITSGANAVVGGRVYSGTAGNNSGSTALMSSKTGAINISGGSAKSTKDSSTAGTISVGGTYSKSVGVVESPSLAGGENYAGSSYNGNVTAKTSQKSRGTQTSAFSNSQSAGMSQTGVTGTGLAIQGSASGAGHVTRTSLDNGNHEYKSYDLNKWDWSKESVDMEYSEGYAGSLGGAGSISGGLTVGNATGETAAAANFQGQSTGTTHTHDTNLYVNAGSAGGANSESAGNGLAGSYNVSGSVVKGEATHKDVNSKGGNSLFYFPYSTTYENEYEVNTVELSDTKFTTSDKFRLGNADANASGEAWVNGTAEAGDQQTSN
jgi:hypothetical protein